MTYATDNRIRIKDRRLRTKALNYDARAGQTIGGNLTRQENGQFGSGGGSSGAANGQQPEKPAISVQDRMEQRRRTREQTLQQAGLTPSEAATLIALLSGPTTELRAASLLKLGLAVMKKDGTVVATSVGRLAARFATRGDLEGVQRTLTLAYDKEQARQDRTRLAADRKRRRQEIQDLRRQQRQPRDVRRENDARRGKDFSVFKQANGRYRWLLISSSAYRDRDQEIVSQKALMGAVAIGDRTGYRGPLRWWHVPGLDIGDCDFQAMHGRFLVESGTFRDERIGAAVARKAHALQASIAFTHPPSDPDARGVFHHIAIFERSLTPYGRAANPLTRLAVKKDRSMDNVKREALKQLLGDDTFLDQLLGAADQTDKAMAAAGVEFKSADPEPVAEKAPPPEPEMESVEDTDEVPLLTTKEIAMIGDHVADRLASMLDLPNQLQLMADKMAGMMGEQSKKKDDTIAAIKEQSDKRSAAFERRLKALEGDQPKAFHRASEADATVADEATIKALGAPGADNANPFADMVQNLFGPVQR